MHQKCVDAADQYQTQTNLYCQVCLHIRAGPEWESFSYLEFHDLDWQTLDYIKIM